MLENPTLAAPVRGVLDELLQCDAAFHPAVAAIKFDGGPVPGPARGVPMDDAIVAIAEADDALEVELLAYTRTPSSVGEQRILTLARRSIDLRRAWMA